jgi:hypothetical protein
VDIPGLGCYTTSMSLKRHDSIFIPGLGLCTISRLGNHESTIEIDVYTSDLEEFAKELVSIDCGDCGNESEEALEDDYKCLACREDDHSVYLNADLSSIVRNAV